MLSICIPVYNFDVRRLTEKLHNQLIKTDYKAEILLLDDGSEKEYCLKNRELNDFDTVQYEELPANVGRSKIRNILAKKANFDYLLFLDCDSDIGCESFLDNYIEATKQHAVIYGGRTYGEKPDDQNYFLQWHYTRIKNGAPAVDRTKSPYYSFCTNNFVVQKKLLLEIPFNEDLKGWGHEDTLFAYELKKKGHKITHINNPIEHKGYVPNREYISNMTQGLRNLIIIYLSGKYPEFTRDFKTLNFLDTLIRVRMLWLFRIFYWLAKPFVSRNIYGLNPKLIYFDLYKLGTISYLWHNRNSN